VAQERQLYARLHIQERLGIPFRQYARVCNDNRPSVANCLAMVVTDDNGVPLAFDASTQTVRGYSPKQFRAAYGVSGVASGQPIIGIVDAYGYPTALADLKTYSRYFKLPALPKCKGEVASSPVPCLEIVNQKGGKKLPTTVDAGWAAEQSIDLDAAHALCENCSILLVEADTNGLGDIFPAENTAARLGANVISNSWGGGEFPGEPSADAQFLTHPGVVMTASTGDYGYAGGVEYPASSPNVVAVGGTSLFLSANGKKYGSEIAWSGTTSGCSTAEPRPAWQPQLSGCPDNRTVADISMDADPNTGAAVYNSNGGCTSDCWYEFGGTSLSAPLVAALFAMGHVSSDDKQAASILYANVSTKNSRDITTGSNGTCDFAYLCNAGTGYDGPTGLGTPRGLGLFIEQ
jgi:subtilase family serine protease